MPKVSTPIILGIESSCDETAAAVLVNGLVRSNVIAGQPVHEQWGGVVPESASRAHQEHIVPVVHEALRVAGVDKHELHGSRLHPGTGAHRGIARGHLLRAFHGTGARYPAAGGGPPEGPHPGPPGPGRR